MFTCSNLGRLWRTLFRVPPAQRVCSRFSAVASRCTNIRCVSNSGSNCTFSGQSGSFSGFNDAEIISSSRRDAHKGKRLESLFEKKTTASVANVVETSQSSTDPYSPHEGDSLSVSQHTHCTNSLSRTTQSSCTSGSGNNRDADVDFLADETAQNALQRQSTSLRDVSFSQIELLEEELIDDNMSYFAIAPRVSENSGLGTTSTSVPGPQSTREPSAAQTEEVGYVPGQQIIAPGLTRYRVDIQYSGYDFDGWFKNSRRRVQAAKDTQLEERIDSSKKHLYDGGGQSPGHSTSTRQHVKTVLEEALAVAIDVSSVDIVAAVIPEVGISVRRLSCHVDIPSYVEMQPRTVIQRATLWLQKNSHPVAILNFKACANQDFHARHSGVKRIYCYRILNRVAPPLFDAGFQWHVDRAVDVARMQRFARVLEGTHDYGYFADPKMANALRRAAMSIPNRASAAYLEEHYEPTSMLGCTLNADAPYEGKGQSAPQCKGFSPALPASQKVPVEKGLTNLQRAAALPTFNQYGQRLVSYDAKGAQYYRAHTNLPTVRTIDRIEVARQDDEILLWFVGKSFLRHQIRNMVSVLKASGQGLWDEQDIHHVFESGFTTSRKRFARERLPAAPAHGLTLWDVEYPAHHRDDYVPQVDSGLVDESDVSSSC